MPRKLTIATRKSRVPPSGYNLVYTRKTPSSNYPKATVVDGYVATAWGYVVVYSQGDNNFKHVTHLQFIFNGFQYTRTFNKRYTPRGIKTKAMAFAQEIAESE